MKYEYMGDKQNAVCLIRITPGGGGGGQTIMLFIGTHTTKSSNM